MATKKAANKKTAAKKSSTPPSRKWSGKVDTDSTHPDHGLFLKSAPEIAKALGTKRVSPGGPASGMRMLTFYINRAGKNLPKERVAVLEHAKEILSGTIAKASSAASSAKTAARKTAAKKTPAKKTAAKKSAAKKTSRTSVAKK